MRINIGKVVRFVAAAAPIVVPLVPAIGEAVKAGKAAAKKSDR